MPEYRTRSGRKITVEALYIVVNRWTGKPYQPCSKGYARYTYPSRDAAERAIAAMPEHWRDRYEARLVV